MGIEATGKCASFKNGYRKAVKTEFRGACERSWSGANAGDLLSTRRDVFLRNRGAIAEEMVHGVALQAADLNGLLVIAMKNAGAFTENFHRTDTRAARTENVGIENRQSRAAKIALRDFFDEARDVNVRRAGRDAGRVEAVETAIGFDERRLSIERRMNLGKELLELGRFEMGRGGGQLTLLRRM
jgi:hypothetical protein